jgi:hypothetical protein
MASFMYNTALSEILAQTLNLDTAVLKIMLVNATYTPNKDDDVVDAGGGSDALDAEIVATNYTGAWGGAGRKTANVSIEQQDASDRVVFKIVDLTWTALGGAANDTVVAAILIKEGGSDDTTSRLIAYLDIANTPTNGGDFTLDFDGTAGVLQFTT